MLTKEAVMKKLFSALLYLPMTIIGIYYGIYFSIPGDGDTIPLASMIIGIMLVAIPMLILSVLNIAMFIINIKYNSTKIQMLTLIGGIIVPVLAFLWLLILSSFTVYITTGIYAFTSCVLGIILLILQRGTL